MYFRLLGLVLFLSSPLTFAQGRSPAVEDFVGIEIEHPEAAPPGTESLFNFEKDINEFEKNGPAAPQLVRSVPSTLESAAPSATTAAAALFFILGLPAMIWFLMMNHLRQKAQVESASNIEVLEKYRRERQESKKNQDEFRKAS